MPLGAERQLDPRSERPLHDRSASTIAASIAIGSASGSEALVGEQPPGSARRRAGRHR